MGGFEPLAEYEKIPLPTLSDTQLWAIVERHGVELDGPVMPLSSTGVVHSLWALGSRYVLRVPKNETMCVGDHRCEAVAIPLAIAAGVRTPALEAFDDSLSILDVPYSIVSRVHGRDLAKESFEHQSYETVGRELATLHATDLSARAHPWLREPGEPPPEDLFERVAQAGLLHADGIAWLASLCWRLDQLAPPDAPVRRAFIHGDVKPDNVMVDEAGDVHLIDWGDAGFGDPAYDFQSLPMRSIELSLRGYRQACTDDPTLEQRVVRRVVARSLSNLCRAPRTGPSWYRPVAANLTDLLTFAADRPEIWNAWTQR